MEDFSKDFEQTVGKALRRDVPLREHSSFRIGGPARYYFEAEHPAELKAAVALCRSRSMPYYLMGGGYNLLFDDAGFGGVIIKNVCRGMALKSAQIDVFSGTKLSAFVEFAAKNGLEGIEFLAGIPGTVGGAVCGNAGAFGRSLGEVLTEAVLLDRKGEEITVGPDYFRFSYRRSFLRTSQEILLKAVFGLRPGDETWIRSRISEYLEQRRTKHPPPDTACAGCYFKNPVLPDGRKVPAGKILEDAGAKTLKSGDAGVSSCHGNFIINEGRARAEDVLSLAEVLKKRVKESSGYELEEEVIFLPATASMP